MNYLNKPIKMNKEIIEAITNKNNFCAYDFFWQELLFEKIVIDNKTYIWDNGLFYLTWKLDLSNKNITNLDWIEHFHQITELDLSSNKIQKIDDNILKLKSLYFLDLSWNYNLKELSKNIFNLPDLGIIILSKNDTNNIQLIKKYLKEIEKSNFMITYHKWKVVLKNIFNIKNEHFLSDDYL